MAIPIGQLSAYMLKLAVKKGRSQLDPSDQAIIDTLTKMGITEVSDALLKALDTGDYSQALNLAKASLFAITKNFIASSKGISEGPLSTWLGKALQAASDRRTDDLASIQSAVADSDAELADAIKQFLNGKVDAISILAARRVAHDQQLVDIAEKASNGDATGVLASASAYAGLSAEQTGAVVAAYNIFSSKKISQQSVNALADFVGKEIPDWAGAATSMKTVYTVAKGMADTITILTSSGASGFPFPKTIDDAVTRQQALIKRKSELSITTASSMASVTSSVMGMAFIAIVYVYDQFTNWLGRELGLTGDKPEDIASAKSFQKQLIDKGLIPPNLDVVGAETPKAVGLFYRGILENLPPRLLITDVSQPCRVDYWRHVEGDVGKACLAYMSGVLKFQTFPEVKNLLGQCVAEGQGGPLTAPRLTKTSLALAAQVFALQYGTPIGVPLLCVSDLLDCPECTEKDLSFDNRAARMCVKKTSISGSTGTGATYSTTVDVYYNFGDVRAPTYYTKLLNCKEVLDWAKSNPYGVVDSSKNRTNPGNIYQITDALWLESMIDNEHYFRHGGGDYDGWFVNAHTVTYVWGEILWRMQTLCVNYQQTLNKNQNPFNTRRQIGTQIALYMDVHPGTTFQQAVQACVDTKNLSETLKQLSEIGVAPINSTFYSRQVAALIASGRCKTRSDAISKIETDAGNAVPTPGTTTYTQWLLDKTSQLEASILANQTAVKKNVSTTPAKSAVSSTSTTSKIVTTGGLAATGFYLGGPVGAAVGAGLGILYNLFK